MSPGEKVKVKVEKDQLEVVNEKALLNVVLGRVSPLKIYLASQGQIAKAQTELYDISLKAITKKHDDLIVKLRKGGQKAQWSFSNWRHNSIEK